MMSVGLRPNFQSVAERVLITYILKRCEPFPQRHQTWLYGSSFFFFFFKYVTVKIPSYYKEILSSQEVFFLLFLLPVLFY